MSYDLYIFREPGKPVDKKAVIEGLRNCGLKITGIGDGDMPDIEIEGFESQLNLQIKDGHVVGGGASVYPGDMESVGAIVDAFKALGFQVADDEDVL